jgi:transposase
MIIGIDLGKNWFHRVGLDGSGTTILRKKLNRAQLAEYAATSPRCIVATESCPGSQYWGRVFTAAGHEVRILPAQFVKPYLKANKNDFNDAAAIAEAGGRTSMRYVPLKTTEQLELQALHRVRRRFIVERTAVINQMRALLLEHGMVILRMRSTDCRRASSSYSIDSGNDGSRSTLRSFRPRATWWSGPTNHRCVAARRQSPASVPSSPPQ